MLKGGTGQKPKPYSRSSIDLGGPKKEWRDVSVSSLRVGDIVVERGLVQHVAVSNIVGSTDVVISYGPDEYSVVAYLYHAADTVKAFVEIEQ